MATRLRWRQDCRTKQDEGKVRRQAVSRISEGASPFSQNVAPAPYRLDVVLAAGCHRELLSELADENVYDLQFGLVHAAIEMVEEHLLGERRSLAKRKQLEHLIFLAGEMNALAADLHCLGVEVHNQIARGNNRLGVTLRAANHGVDARYELILVEGLGHVIVSPKAQALHLVLNAGETGQDENRRVHLADAEGFQNFVTAHVGQIQIEKDDVVVVKFAQIDTFLAEIRRIDVETFRLQHQFDALRGGGVVFNKKNSHPKPLQFDLRAPSGDGQEERTQAKL